MSTPLWVVTKSEVETQVRERITLLEMRPKNDWFVQTITERGRKVWYLRFSVTGMFPRLYGPFQSKRKATLFLDRVVSRVTEFSPEFDNYAEEYGPTREFEKLNWGPLIEHPLFKRVPVVASTQQCDSMTEQPTWRESCRIGN